MCSVEHQTTINFGYCRGHCVMVNRVKKNLLKCLMAVGIAPALLAPVLAQAANEAVWLLTADHHLLRINADEPQKVLKRVALSGLPEGHSLVGIDYRVSRGVMFALSNHAQIYTVDTESGALKPVGKGGEVASAPLNLLGRQYGFDFNPAADRIRVVNDRRQNVRFHPDTGALAATDPNLRYAESDQHANKSPHIGAAAYTYNKNNEKLTTNFAIDLNLGTLALQGTRESVVPAVSPNEGVLFTVGALGHGPLTAASFDIADVSNRALAALRPAGRSSTGLYDIDLATGKARMIGRLPGGKPILGLAIEP